MRQEHFPVPRYQEPHFLRLLGMGLRVSAARGTFCSAHDLPTAYEAAFDAFGLTKLGFATEPKNKQVFNSILMDAIKSIRMIMIIVVVIQLRSIDSSRCVLCFVPNSSPYLYLLRRAMYTRSLGQCQKTTVIKITPRRHHIDGEILLLIKEMSGILIASLIYYVVQSYVVYYMLCTDSDILSRTM